MRQGFLGYVNTVKAGNHKQLWPTLRQGRYGWGDKVSKWFGEKLKIQCGITPSALECKLCRMKRRR